MNNNNTTNNMNNNTTNTLTIEDLLQLILIYNPEEVEIIKKAYDYAAKLHQGQVRQSGEEYITHPLNVAYILAEMHADRDTVCAALLHDTLEDTDTTKEEIITYFNETVANLVDGVTKISKLNFSTKQEQNYANTRKIITSITEDVRIIIIKLADRLHNMRTLQYKKPHKQKENALETLDIFVPLAYYIGAYRIKSELEDLSFKYLSPNEYDGLLKQHQIIEEESMPMLEEMQDKIQKRLADKGIHTEIKIRTKNIYGIHKRLEEGYNLSNIHDLFSIKVMVDEEVDCYKALGIVHQAYHPLNSKFKDYICDPKTNMYRSLHTTVFGPADKLVQIQIRSKEDDKIASFGLTAYWDINKGKARDVMQDDLKQKFQFFRSLVEIDKTFSDDENEAFVEQVKKELLSDNVYSYTPDGTRIELAKGSTIIDFAYKIHTRLGHKAVEAIVNDKIVPLDYRLQNQDRVKIITGSSSTGPQECWEDIATTAKAKRKIREFKKYRM